MRLYPEDGRAASYLRTLKRAVKFLLFREDYPKHSVVVDLHPIHLAILLPLPVTLCGACILVGWFYGGAIGALLMYLALCFMTLEIPHCIFDR